MLAFYIVFIFIFPRLRELGGSFVRHRVIFSGILLIGDKQFMLMLVYFVVCTHVLR
uniref:Uncharacterized protein n=1 Tax=Rhizophora mucronata TaxID=61149 RepID=A0A2P2Q029_RHIMU